MDEADVELHMQTLEARAGVLRAQLENAGKVPPALPEKPMYDGRVIKRGKVDCDDEIPKMYLSTYEWCDRLEAHCAELETLIRLAAQPKPISVPVAEPAARHSGELIVSSLPARNPSATKPAVQPARKMNATEKIAAAKGKTVAQLLNAGSVVETKPKPESGTAKVLAAKGVSTLEALVAKRGKLAAIIAALFLSLAVTAKAQFVGPRVLMGGGTNKVTALSSNEFVFACDEFPNFGVQFSAASISGSTSNLILYFYRSLDTATHESTPFTNLVLTLAGTSTNTVIKEIYPSGAAGVKVIVASTNTGGFATNLSLIARFKAPKTKLTTQ